jgi:hypothetical protein
MSGEMLAYILASNRTLGCEVIVAPHGRIIVQCDRLKGLGY